MALNGSVTVLSVVDTVNLGVPFPIALSVVNSGSETFTPGLHNLSAESPQDNTFWGNARIVLPAVIGPGTELKFTTNLTPTTAGTHVLQYILVKEGVTRFGIPSMPRVINVVGSQPQPPQGAILGLRSDPTDLVGDIIINTGPYIADIPLNVHVTPWKNNSGRRMLITDCDIWLGVDKKHTCDAYSQVRRSDGSLMADLAVDHYTEGPQGAAIKQQKYSPHYMILEKGESIDFQHFGFPIYEINEPKVPFNVHWKLSLWWLWG